MGKVKELIDRISVNCDRIGEIAHLCEQEKRERTDAETAEFETLQRENQVLQMKLQAVAAEHLRENPNAKKDAEKILRENVANGRKTEIVLMRDVMTVTDVTSGGIVPLNIQDMLKPLNEGFILDKVGLSMPTGLAGDYVWPAYEMVEASIAGEGVALADKKIAFSKPTANPERIGIAIPVSNQSLNQTDGILETVVREIMPQSIKILLNKILFSTTKVTGATNLVGPFVSKAATAATLSATPTFAELNKMKAAVLETGIDGEHLCWVMTKSMKAVLEGEPVNSKGVYVPICQNDIICGLPVYTTNAIRSGKTEFIGLGDWRYQPMGLFGSLRFVVDPYSKARNDSVDFVLNTDYGTKTLRPEAFALGKVTAVGS